MDQEKQKAYEEERARLLKEINDLDVEHIAWRREQWKIERDSVLKELDHMLYSPYHIEDQIPLGLLAIYSYLAPGLKITPFLEDNFSHVTLGEIELRLDGRNLIISGKIQPMLNFITKRHLNVDTSWMLDVYTKYMRWAGALDVIMATLEPKELEE